MRSAPLIIWAACSHPRCRKLPDNKAPVGKPSGLWRSRRHDDGGYFLIPPDPPLIGGASPTVAPEKDLSSPMIGAAFPLARHILWLGDTHSNQVTELQDRPLQRAHCGAKAHMLAPVRAGDSANFSAQYLHRPKRPVFLVKFQMVRQIQRFGAGEGNRTPVLSLGSFCSAIELHPQRPAFDGFPVREATLQPFDPGRSGIAPSRLADLAIGAAVGKRRGVRRGRRAAAPLRSLSGRDRG